MMEQHRATRWLAALVAAALSLAAASAFAQAPVVVLRTSPGAPLISATQTFSLQLAGPAYLQFVFGFATDEDLVPGTFLDSLTLTLQDANSSLGVIYNTTDRSGSYWAPLAPGGISLSPGSVTRQPVPFPDLAPDHAHKFAYLVTAPVPDELLGREVNFYADLFNNGNSEASLGWMSGIAVVPEPSTWLIAFVGLLLYFGFTWRTE